MFTRAYQRWLSTQIDAIHGRLLLTALTAILQQLNRMETMTMSALDDLNTNIALLATAVAAEIAALQAANAAGDPAAVEAAAQKIAALTTQLTASVTPPAA